MYFQIPTLRSVIEKEIGEAQEMERNMQESDPSYLPVLSEENIEAFWEMAETGKATNSFNRDVWNIIEEEAEPYFAGARTLDETVELIQNRAEIFVSENWG